MAKIRTSDAVLEERTKAAIEKHMKEIRAEIVNRAHKQGHKDIKDSHIKSVTFKNLADVAYEIRKFDIGKFVITNPESLTFLDTGKWKNNGPQTPTQTLEVVEETDDTYTWTISAGVTIKYETSTEVKIPLPVGGSTKSTWSFQFNLNVTKGTAHHEKHGWRRKFEQPVSPYSYLEMTVYGVEVVGFSPFSITAFANGTAKCSCVIDYWGKRTKNFDIDLKQILNDRDRTFTSEGRIDGIQGYEWRVETKERPLTEEEKKAAPRGVSGGALVLDSLRIPKRAQKAAGSRKTARLASAH